MSDDLRAKKDEATRLLLKGKLPKALEAWQAVAAAAPDDLTAHQKVAELLVKLERRGEAVAAYEALARRLAEKGQFFKASAVCRVLLSLDPGHQRTQELIAGLYSRSAPVSGAGRFAGATRAALGKAAASAPAQVESPAVAAVPPAPPVEVEVEVPIEVAPPVPAADALPAIPLFSSLSRAELVSVLSSAMEVRAFSAGDVVVAEGAAGDSMFALAEGTASVYRGYAGKDRRKVASVATGDIFGEAAMVSGSARLATVVADTDAVALEFRREAMGKVIAQHAEVGQKLDAFYRDRLLANVLRASPVLRALPDADKKALSGSFQPCAFVDGQRIINEGAPADSVYLLLRGRCAATHASGDRYPDLTEGDLFGEISVLTDAPATASVAALGPVFALRLGGGEFKARVLKHPGASLAVKKLAQVRLNRTALYDRELAEEAGEDSRV